MITFKGINDTSSFGYLGNQMFEIASTIGIANKNKQNFSFPKWNYQKYFKNRLPYNDDFIDIVDYNEQTLSYQDIKLKSSENYNLQGYFQSWKYFDRYREQILYYFTISDDIREYVSNKYGNILKDNNTCSIHVRLGDYRNFPNHHPILTKEYYDIAMSMFDNNIKYLVFSNEIDTCKEMFKGDNFIFIENEENIVDMYIMSLCKNNIIANSSFSWWGAYLNINSDKKIIAPRTWFGVAYGNKDIYDRLLPNWFKI